MDRMISLLQRRARSSGSRVFFTWMLIVAGVCMCGLADAARGQTLVYEAYFEDGEVNPGRWPDSGIINTTAYATDQPEAFSTAPGAEPDGDAFGWQNRASFNTNGDTTIIFTADALDGENVAEVQSRTLRSDIEHTLVVDSIYTFRFWYLVPDGQDLTFFNKVVCRDQTNDHTFVDTGNDDYTTAPAHNVWYSRTVTFDTVGYGHAGEPIDFRFGAWFSYPGDDSAVVYTDGWTVSYAGLEFVDVTSDVGLDVFSPGFQDISAAWGDVDNDGWIDLYIGSYAGGEAGLFVNSGGGSFIARSAAAGAMNNHPGLFVDYNNDGRPDIATAMAGGHMMRNNGDDTFSHVAGLFDEHDFQCENAAWADFDGDGDLDSYRAGWEAAPEGPYYPDAIFTQTNTSGIHFERTWWQEIEADRKAGRAVTIADFDEDGDVDIYVSNYRISDNFLWINDGDGNFTEEAAAYGIQADDIPCDATYTGGHTLGSAWGDLDNDGHLDLVVGNLSHGEPCEETPRFYRNMGAAGNWHFQDMSTTVNMPFVQSHASPTLGDFDNDGDLDVFITAASGEYPGEQSTLMCNDGNWNFTDCSDTYGLRLATLETNFGAAWGDYDNDGDLDLFTYRNLYRNPGSGNHWLQVRMRGNGVHVNRDAVGAQVRINLGGGVILTRQVENATGWGNQNDPRLHFGLGANAGPVDLEILWPDGSTEVQSDIAVDQVVNVVYQGVGAPREDIAFFRVPWFGTGSWYASYTDLTMPEYFDDADGGGVLPGVMPTSTSLEGFGLESGIPMMGDVNGDGIDDIVIAQDFDDGAFQWAAKHSINVGGFGEFGTGGSPDSFIHPHGLSKWNAGTFLADVNGDGYEDAVTINTVTGAFDWQAARSNASGLDNTVTDYLNPFGTPHHPLYDIPVMGDFNGDGYVDAGFYRRGEYQGGDNLAFWHNTLSSAAGLGNTTEDNIGQLGFGRDIPLVGDFNGDGRDDGITVRDNGAGNWRWQAGWADPNGLIQFGDGSSTYVSNEVNFGFSPSYTGHEPDIPFVADINGDGMDDICLLRRNDSTGYWEWHVGFTWNFFGEILLYAGSFGDDSGDFGIPSDNDLAPLTAHLHVGSNVEDMVVFERTWGAGQWQASYTEPYPEYLSDEYLPPFGDTVLDNFGMHVAIPMLGDVNGDGIDDAVVAQNYGDAALHWAANHSEADVDGVGVFGSNDTGDSVVESLGSMEMNHATFIEDVNGDGCEDAVTVDVSIWDPPAPAGDLIWKAAHSTGAGLDDKVVSSVVYGIEDAPYNDIAVMGDFNGDGYVDAGFYYRGEDLVGDSLAYWHSTLSSAAGLGDDVDDNVGQLGYGRDTPLVGDINGDGRDDGIVVRDNGAGNWEWQAGYANPNGLIQFGDGSPQYVSNVVHFGFSPSYAGGDADEPFVADINGDGMADICLLRDVGAGFWEWHVGFTTEGGQLYADSLGDDVTQFGGLYWDDIPLIGTFRSHVPVCDPHDWDDDGDVDMDDFAYFADCMAGPDATPDPETECLEVFDADMDGDVDSLDFAEFQLLFTGG